jgi:predicted PurR-regulated permease PerM
MHPSEKALTVHISFPTIIKTVVFLLFIYTLFLLKELVIIILTSIVIASAVDPFTRALQRIRIPRPFAVGIVFSALIATIVSVVYLFVPVLIEQFSGFILTIPDFLQRLDFLAQGNTYFSELNILGDIQVQLQSVDIISTIKAALFGIGGGVVNTAGALFNSVTQLVLITVISFYFAVQEKGIEDFLRVIIPLKNEAYAIDLWKRSQAKIGKWMQGQIILGLLMGVLTFLGLWAIGLREYALFLSILIAFAELIPLFGPILAMIPAIFLGFTVGGPEIGLQVTGFYIILQQLENHVLVPLVNKKLVGVPPLMVILSLLIGASLLGFWGLILAVPLAAAILEFTRDVLKRKDKAVTMANILSE